MCVTDLQVLLAMLREKAQASKPAGAAAEPVATPSR